MYGTRPHPSDRNADLLHRELDQRARRDHVQLGKVLMEVAQWRERPRRLLNLIEEEQGLAGCDPDAQCQSQITGDAAGVEIAVE